MIILTLNAGSSSLKFKLFDFSSDTPVALLEGQADAIGQDSAMLKHKNPSGQKIEQTIALQTHADALKQINELVQSMQLEIDGIAHRVVHGGERFAQPVLVNEETLRELKALIPLAPLHNPANILGIETAQILFPKAHQVAVFDTAFHQTMPEKAYTYAIDQTIAKTHSIRRYGFHGTSYDYVSTQAAKALGKALEHCQMIICHLGNGASVCCIKGGQSIDTSMGMTPLAGLVMGTRSGDIDPGAVVYLQSKGFSANEIDTLLNKKSGLKGLCSTNDMREVEQLASNGNIDAKLALDCFIYRVQQYIGAYLTQLPTCDAIVFTGGIGENGVEIRDAIIQPLAHLGIGTQIPAMVVNTDEEYQMANALYALTTP